MTHGSRQLGIAVACGVCVTGWAVTVGSSTPVVVEQSEPVMRLYVLDGGTLTIADPSGFGVTIADVKGFTSMPVPAYLVVHPAGTLLWDTGLSDDLMGRPAEETQRGRFGQVVTTTLKGQLSDLGYAPDDMTYLAMSHLHFDHVGNANEYAGATWIVQEADHGAIDFTDRDGTADLSALEYSETVIIDGDHDVFGDGRVVIKATPGHTPGHQSLYVNLSETGPIVLSGDLYHYEAERALGKMPPREVGPGVTAGSRAALEAFLVETGADLWIQHESMLWATLDKSPAYYE